VIKPGEAVTFGDNRIRPVEAYNTEGGSSTRKLHRKGNGVGYLLNIRGEIIYYAGDTDFIPEMRELGNVVPQSVLSTEASPSRIPLSEVFCRVWLDKRFLLN